MEFKNRLHAYILLLVLCIGVLCKVQAMEKDKVSLPKIFATTKPFSTLHRLSKKDVKYFNRPDEDEKLCDSKICKLEDKQEENNTILKIRNLKAKLCEAEEKRRDAEEKLEKLAEVKRAQEKKIRDAHYDKEEELYRAIGDNDINKITMLLEAKADPNKTSSYYWSGENAVHRAVEKRRHEALVLLIENGGNPNSASKCSLWPTPLLIAVGAEDVRAVEILLKNKANPNVANSYGTTPLYLCMDKKNYVIMKLLVAAGANYTFKKNNGYSSFLHKAVKKGDIHALQALLDGGANPNVDESENKYGSSSLHVAARTGNNKALELLLKYKASPNVQEKDDKFKYAALHWVVQENNVEGVKILLNCNTTNINLKDGIGCTPLHGAVIRGNTQITSMLLEAKADPSLQTVDGITPLSIAVYNNDPACIKLLMPYGCDAFFLYAALRTGNNKLLKLLLEGKADPNSINTSDNKDRSSCLHIAAQKGNNEALEMLLEHEANPNAQEKDETFEYAALHWVVQKNNSRGVEILLKHKANINLQAGGGYTPLHRAVNKGNAIIAKMLINAHADPCIANNDKRIPLHMAVDNKDYECIKELMLPKNYELHKRQLEYLLMLTKCKEGRCWYQLPKCVLFYMTDNFMKISSNDDRKALITPQRVYNRCIKKHEETGQQVYLEAAEIAHQRI